MDEYRQAYVLHKRRVHINYSLSYRLLLLQNGWSLSSLLDNDVVNALYLLTILIFIFSCWRGELAYVWSCWTALRIVHHTHHTGTAAFSRELQPHAAFCSLRVQSEAHTAHTQTVAIGDELHHHAYEGPSAVQRRLGNVYSEMGDGGHGLDVHAWGDGLSS